MIACPQQQYPKAPPSSVVVTQHDTSLIELVVGLDGLGLACVQHHGRVFRVAIARDLVASLRRDGGPGELLASCMIVGRVVRDSLLSLDIEDLALGLAVAPVPADGVALLGTLLGLLARAPILAVLVFLVFVIFILIIFLVIAVLLLGIAILFAVGFRFALGCLSLLVGSGLVRGCLLSLVACCLVFFLLLLFCLIVACSFLLLLILIINFLLLIVLLTVLLQKVMTPILQRRVRLGLLDLFG